MNEIIQYPSDLFYSVWFSWVSSMLYQNKKLYSFLQMCGISLCAYCNFYPSVYPFLHPSLFPFFFGSCQSFTIASWLFQKGGWGRKRKEKKWCHNTKALSSMVYPDLNLGLAHGKASILPRWATLLAHYNFYCAMLKIFSLIYFYWFIIAFVLFAIWLRSPKNISKADIIKYSTDVSFCVFYDFCSNIQAFDPFLSFFLLFWSILN